MVELRKWHEMTGAEQQAWAHREVVKRDLSMNDPCGLAEAIRLSVEKGAGK